MSLGSKDSSIKQELDRLQKRRPRLQARASLIQAIRDFFVDRDYLEVETPLLIPAPAPEMHIDAISAGHSYLHTSPELCMKRLLSAGYSKIFQISKCFRSGERGDLHLPEFTLLEWYRTGWDYMALMEECEELFLFVTNRLGIGDRLQYQGKVIELQRPWRRISLREAFDRYASISVGEAIENGCFDEVMAKDIEPHLGIPRPTFVYDYPSCFAALARLRSDRPEVAERCEIYMAGVELANAFSELTNVGEQRARFDRDRQVRKDLGKPVYPVPERFLSSLEHMPEAAGIALGVDRLAMILTDSARVEDVLAFAPEEL